VNDSKEYRQKKDFFKNVITVYGRHVVKEVMQNNSIKIYKLHLADSNKADNTINQILKLATKRKIEIVYHDKKALARISKAGKQDQGVAADIISSTYKNTDEIYALKSYRFLALEGIQNPQNLGLIIRSAAAGNIDGIILPKKNSAKISPLVIKASAGTLFKIDIYYCDTLDDVLKNMQDKCEIFALSSHSKEDIYSLHVKNRAIFVLGNESEGISENIKELCNKSVKIPMQRDVESLNVAITAALISFLPK